MISDHGGPADGVSAPGRHRREGLRPLLRHDDLRRGRGRGGLGGPVRALPRCGHQLLRLRGHLRVRALGGDPRPADGGLPGRADRGDQVRQSRARGGSECGRRLAAPHPRGGRGQPAPAAHRPDRPLLHALPRSGYAGGGDAPRPGRPGAPGQGALPGRQQRRGLAGRHRPRGVGARGARPVPVPPADVQPAEAPGRGRAPAAGPPRGAGSLPLQRHGGWDAQRQVRRDPPCPGPAPREPALPGAIRTGLDAGCGRPVRRLREGARPPPGQPGGRVGASPSGGDRPAGGCAYRGPAGGLPSIDRHPPDARAVGRDRGPRASSRSGDRPDGGSGGIRLRPWRQAIRVARQPGAHGRRRPVAARAADRHPHPKAPIPRQRGTEPCRRETS